MPEYVAGERKWVRYRDLPAIGERALRIDHTITPGAVDGLTVERIWEPEEVLLELLEAGLLV